MKKLYIIQSIVLLAGTAFAWFTVVNDILRFIDAEGTFFKIKDCTIPNPVITACFYGAFAFLIAFIWSLYILNKTELGQQIKQQARLVWLLVASTIFAWTNFTLEAMKFYKPRPGQVRICSPDAATPWETACFIGASIFLIALITGLVIKYKNSKLTT
jgi:hypothetical protein